MKKLTLTLVLFYCQLTTTNCQQNYWQQEVNFTINVSLNDTANTLTGFEKIEYINHSPDTLRFIWFHIWPNAYKNDKTAFSDQLLENGSTKFYFSDKEEKGYINRLDFKVNNITAATEDHPQHIDIIKLVLPSPLAPGQKMEITTPFHVKLPYNYSRGGHDGQSYQITQWYPKPAVYDSKGWHPMPYLDQGEFYSDFGSYDVKITVPENYVVAATGELQNAEEKEWLKTRASFVYEPVKRKVKTKGGSYKTVTDEFPRTASNIKILRFKQNNVHDFAWFADKRFIVNRDTCLLASGKMIDVFTYYTSRYETRWRNSVKNAKDAVRHYSNLVGEYPYSVVSVVQGPASFGGGMEYPTITVISPGESERELDNTIAHEIGHNWFYGILATNERDYPWMDEGTNTFYDDKYRVARYGKKANTELMTFGQTVTEKKDQPISTHSEKYSVTNYYLTTYYKTAQWLRYLESLLGEEAFKTSMQEYYKRWQFKHPTPEDFKKAMEESSGKNLDSAFSYLSKTGRLPNQQVSGTRVISILQPEHFNNVWYNEIRTKKDVISVGPSIGFNSYDKFMLGALVTNIKIPVPSFQFFLAPMYSFGSKEPSGTGFLNYSYHPSTGFISKIDIGVSGSKFLRDRYKDTVGQVKMSVDKIVPRLRFTFREKDPRSTFYSYLQLKTYLIGEDFFRSRRDSLFVGSDTIIRNVPYSINERRTLNQLLFVVENYRELYPYRAEFNAEQGKGFVRLAFTGTYFLNYAKNPGGVNVRLFAGKFIYTDKQEANSFLYGLHLSAPKGGLDYTYSDYFLGRNDYPFNVNGYKWTIPYQQIMIRDGAFKVNTDGGENVGWSDDWMAAMNFTFDIPPGINPLTLLPFKIPVKAFLDVGTYGKPWEKGSSLDRFLYDFGLQVSLLKDFVNIYIPILYSKPFKDYYNQDYFSGGKGKFLKTISFSIDLAKFNSKRYTKGFPF